VSYIFKTMCTCALHLEKEFY